ncbi:response regulator [bacterium]|nr:response regulator [bacterium]
MTKILVVDDSPNWVKYHTFALNELFNEQVEILQAYSAKEGVEKLLYNIDNPFDIILTDMQMEPDFLPMFAGEWFIKQIQYFKEYKNTKICIISAAENIKSIAEKYGVSFIRKSSCRQDGAYDIIKNFIC